MLKQQKEKQQQHQQDIKIDIIERLPFPYGLVRSGVAPDHPEVKNVQNDFDDTVFHDDKHVSFYGNVDVGKTISLDDLRRLYDLVILAYGCDSDRTLSFQKKNDNTPNKNILSAREFVNWYNGHPDYQWVGKDVEVALSKNQMQNIVIVGQGNVALDCARILAKTREELDPTDLTTPALNILHNVNNNEKTIPPKRNISVVGRRGHVQGAFTIKELRELTKLTDAVFTVRKDELEMGLTPVSKEELKQFRPKQRIDKLLHEVAASSSDPDNTPSDTTTEVQLRFLLSPNRVEEDGLVFERTELVGDDIGKQSAKGTGQEERMHFDLCLVSIGYKARPIPGLERVYDDTTGTLNNAHGKVMGESKDQKGSLLAPVYVSGWLKRGPSGIIGTNIADAKDTVGTIIHDMMTNKMEPKSSDLDQRSLKAWLEEEKKQRNVIDWNGYEKINSVETSKEHKRHPEQPREKLIHWDELLYAAK